MNTPETTQMIVATLMDAQSTLKALNERSKNYYDMLSTQNEKIRDNVSQIKEITRRVEKVEIALANIDIIKDHSKKLEDLTTELVSLKPNIEKVKAIDTISKDVTILKRDRWWISTLAGAIGSGIGFVLHLIFFR